MNRNLAERERRSNMRNLFSRLFSLIPSQSSRMSIPDRLEQATVYISQFQRHLEGLRQTRMQLEEANTASRTTIITPAINIIDSNSSMEVNLITGSELKLALSEIVCIIEEEGGQVISLAYSDAGYMNILSIHCQAAISSSNGINRSRLLQRLRTMIEE